MSNDVDMKITDNTELLEKATSEAIAKALEAVGITAEAYAKLLCPVDTGRLRNSISHDVRADDNTVYIGTNVEYAPYVEMGTSRTKAQPFLQPAATGHTEEYKQIFEQQLQQSQND